MNKIVNKSSLAYLLCISMFSFMSCKKASDFEKLEKEAIAKYLSDNSDMNFELKPSGLYYCEVEPGTGSVADSNDVAYIFYTVYYTNGVKYLTNDTSVVPLTVKVKNGELIEGMDEGLTYMRKGGKARLIVPSSLGIKNDDVDEYTPFIIVIRMTDLVKFDK